MGIITRNFANNVLSSGTLDATDGIDGVIPSSNIANASVTNITELPAAIEVIESVATDPGSPDEGEVWYNSTDNVIKLQSVSTVGTWATGGNLNTKVYGNAMAGTQTATLSFGGTPYPPPSVGRTELYNGTAWTNNPTGMNTARYYLAGFGTQTAAVAAGGVFEPSYSMTNTESWNGSSWTSNPTGLNTGRFNIQGSGTQTNGIVAGGDTYNGSAPSVPTRTSGAVELYNGTSWTSTTSLNTARRNNGQVGPSTSALVFGGFIDFPLPPFTTTATESWNGTSWTTLASLPQAKWNLGSAGTQTAALGFGGSINPAGGAPNNSTISWNGSSWSVLPATLGTTRQTIKGAGTQSAAIGAGGYVTPGTTTATEEWTGPGVAVTQTVTVS